jgi:hypothetical protein
MTTAESTPLDFVQHEDWGDTTKEMENIESIIAYVERESHRELAHWYEEGDLDFLPPAAQQYVTNYVDRRPSRDDNSFCKCHPSVRNFFEWTWPEFYDGPLFVGCSTCNTIRHITDDPNMRILSTGAINKYPQQLGNVQEFVPKGDN